MKSLFSRKTALAVSLTSIIAVMIFLGFSLIHPPALVTSGDQFANRCMALTYSDQLSATNDHPGMVWVSSGSFEMGGEIAYFEEGPIHQEQVSGFWIDQTEVTNQQFSEFVSATSYLTLAEKGQTAANIPAEQQVPGSAVFMLLLEGEEYNPLEGWWRFVPGTDWRHPEGPQSSIVNRDKHPAVHIAYEDALAYAQWKGHELPTEEQFEYAAQSSSRKDVEGQYQSNTWQGFFPFQNQTVDGYNGTAPVACYQANNYGIYDLIGNVWEWTSSPYYSSHQFADKASFPQGYDPMQPNTAVAVIKGGSFLCAPNFCMRYRPESRQGQSLGLGTSHIGFRTVVNVQ